MHTIMEQKIKVLVQSVAHAVGVVLSSSQVTGPTGQALAKVSTYHRENVHCNIRS